MEGTTELDRLIADQGRDSSTTMVRPEFRGQVPLSKGVENCVGVDPDGTIVTFWPRAPKGTYLTGTATYHGTRTGYKNHGCRCAPCTEAQRVAIAAQRARRRNGN